MGLPSGIDALNADYARYLDSLDDAALTTEPARLHELGLGAQASPGSALGVRSGAAARWVALSGKAKGLTIAGAVFALLAGIGSVLPDQASTQAASAKQAAVEESVAAAPVAATPAVKQVKLADYVTTADCSKAQSVLEASRTKSAILAQKAKAEDSYAAAVKVTRYDFTSDSASRSASLDNAMEKVAAAAVTRAEAAGSVDDTSAVQDAVSQCKLDSLYSKAQRAASGADSAIESVVSLAEDVPWYPKGYSPTQDEDVAFQWVRNPNCDYFGCWQVRVVVNKYCSTLYMELATENSAGDKDGFTNDILSGLAPGDHGLMTMTNTSSGSHSASVSKVSCY
jgi:hypothetical protein